MRITWILSRIMRPSAYLDKSRESYGHLPRSPPGLPDSTVLRLLRKWHTIKFQQPSLLPNLKGWRKVSPLKQNRQIEQNSIKTTSTRRGENHDGMSRRFLEGQAHKSDFLPSLVRTQSRLLVTMPIPTQKATATSTTQCEKSSPFALTA